MTTSFDILVLPGDGIGPEVVEPAWAVLTRACQTHGVSLRRTDGLLGGAAIDADGTPLSDATLAAAKGADAVLLGAVGGPAWDDLPTNVRPERGLLGLRSGLGLFANLRPALLSAALAESPRLPRSILAPAL